MKQFLDKLKRQEQITIVALGDSNTELTWHTAGRLNWVGLLQEALFETYGRNLDHYTLWMQAENRDKQYPQPANHLWMRMSDAIHPGPLGHLQFYRELAPLFELPLFFAWEH